MQLFEIPADMLDISMDMIEFCLDMTGNIVSILYLPVPIEAKGMKQIQLKLLRKE